MARLRKHRNVRLMLHLCVVALKLISGFARLEQVTRDAHSFILRPLQHHGEESWREPRIPDPSRLHALLLSSVCELSELHATLLHTQQQNRHHSHPSYSYTQPNFFFRRVSLSPTQDCPVMPLSPLNTITLYIGLHRELLCMTFSFHRTDKHGCLSSQTQSHCNSV